jgi:hypothetical protein
MGWSASRSALRTYGSEGALTPHVLYLLVTTGVARALPEVREGRTREEKGPTIAKLALTDPGNAHYKHR